jgi:hypothetical protein
VVFPAPEGEESTSIRPRRAICSLASFNILNLFAQPVDRGLERQPGLRDLRIVGLRADRVGLAVEFLGQEFQAAADRLDAEGIDAEVLDLRSLVPLDTDRLYGSIERTNRLLVVDEDYRSFGVSGELIARATGSGTARPRARCD